MTDELDIPLGEVLFEFRRVGNVFRVSAIDPRTNTEVSMVAPKGYGDALIKRIAIRKLKYVIKKKGLA